jgi:hypothetical protein
MNTSFPVLNPCGPGGALVSAAVTAPGMPGPGMSSPHASISRLAILTGCTAVLLVSFPAAQSGAARRSGCATALVGDCGAARHDVFACAQCAGEHQQQLQAAGCTNSLISSWCAGEQISDDIGDALQHRYTVYADLPTNASEAIAQGFQPLVADFAGGSGPAACTADTGTPWTHGGKLARDTPYALHFSAAGQLAAITVSVFQNRYSPGSAYLATMIDRGYLTNDTVAHSLTWAGANDWEPYVGSFTVSFRESGASLCDTTTTFDELLGTRIAVLSHGQVYPAASAQTPPRRAVTHVLPRTAAAAEAEGYVRGACFDGMGWHYFKDLVAPDRTISWEASNLMPIVPMYNPIHGNLNAIFFASAVVQQSNGFFPAANSWEPVPLTNSMQCANFCDSSCGFAGAASWDRRWSTMHFYFHPHSQSDLTCSKSSEIRHCFSGISCCPN